MKEKVAFLVLSCDKYYDLLSPFSILFNRFWPDCPYQKFAATNTKAFKEGGFNPILMGEDISWSAGLRKVLTELSKSYDYVLITLEDLFLRKTVDSKDIETTIASFVEKNGNYLRFYSHFKPSKRVTTQFGLLEKNTPYRQNCVYAIWRIEVLMAILRDDENAWDFEKKAVHRGYEYDGFYAVYKSKFKILNTLIKGRWVPYDYRKVRKLIPGFSSKREKMSKREEMILNLKRFIFRLFFTIIPKHYQMRILKKRIL